jgi:hypothetical protein
MGKQVILGEHTYPTKKAASDAIRDILHGYELGETLSDEHAEFMLCALRNHNEADKKIGCGVVRFEVRSDDWGGRCFWLVRTDGTETDFSYRSCLTHPTAKTDAQKGFRSAVQTQVDDFKQETFAGQMTVPCAVTGRPITIRECHVDHDPTFESLLNRFLSERGLTLEQVQVRETVDGMMVTELASEDLMLDWQRFHREHARLRVVHWRVNLSELRRKPA